MVKKISNTLLGVWIYNVTFFRVQVEMEKGWCTADTDIYIYIYIYSQV